jgi:hypothetical protein
LGWSVRLDSIATQIKLGEIRRADFAFDRVCFLGGSHLMRLKTCMPRAAWSVILVPALLAGLVFPGCGDSTSPTADTPKQTDQQRDAMKRAEESANEATKRGGKTGTVLKLGGKPGAGVGKAE